MKLEEEPREDPRVAHLVAAEARDANNEDPRKDTLIQECKYKRAEREARIEESELIPLRVMAWHIDELGGGTYRSTERDPLLIDAYATLVDKLNIDIVVLLAVRRTIGRTPKSLGTHLVMVDEEEGTGMAEVDRILAALSKRDPAGGWECQLPVDADDGKTAYLGNATTCVLHRTSKGISFCGIDLLESPRDESSGLTGRLICATFDAPEHGSCPVRVVAPLGSPADDDPIPEGLEPTADFPPCCILAVSGDENLTSNGAFNGLRADLGGIYQSPKNEGSDAYAPFWERVAFAHDGLLVNFLALSPADIAWQDAQMHWEALKLNEHPEASHHLEGVLSDALMVCHQPMAGRPTVDEVRVVDLVRAALPSAHLGAQEDPEDAEDLDVPTEDAVLADLIEEFLDDEDAPSAAVALARHLAEQLSKRWPLVAQVRYDPAYAEDA